MKIAILGNCTVDTLAACLGRMVDADIEVFWAQRSRQAQGEALCARIGSFDAVFAHIDAIGPAVADQLRRDAKRFVELPPLTFAGFHPDLVIIDGAMGWMGRMHSALIIAGFLLELPPSRTMRLFNRFVFASLGYLDRYATERQRVVELGEATGFDLRKGLETWPKPFVYDVLHSKFEVNRWLAEQLASRLELPTRAIDWTDPGVIAAVDHTRYVVTWPVYPEIAVPLGLRPERIVYRCNGLQRIELLLGEFIHRSYAIYRKADRTLLEEAVASEMSVLSDVLA